MKVKVGIRKRTYRDRKHQEVGIIIPDLSDLWEQLRQYDDCDAEWDINEKGEVTMKLWNFRKGKGEEEKKP